MRRGTCRAWVDTEWRKRHTLERDFQSADAPISPVIPAVTAALWGALCPGRGPPPRPASLPMRRRIGLAAKPPARLTGGSRAAPVPARRSWNRLAVPSDALARPPISMPSWMPTPSIRVGVRSVGRTSRRTALSRSVANAVSNLEPRSAGQGAPLTAPCERSGEWGERVRLGAWWGAWGDS